MIGKILLVFTKFDLIPGMEYRSNGKKNRWDYQKIVYNISKKNLQINRTRLWKALLHIRLPNWEVGSHASFRYQKYTNHIDQKITCGKIF